MKAAVAKILLILTMFITFVSCSSCASSSYLFGPGNLLRDKRRSFIKIDIYKNVTVTRTSSSAAEEYELDINSSASGFIIGHEREITLVATSAHVCTMLSRNQLKFFIPNYSSNSSGWKISEKAAFILNDYKGRTYASIPIKYDLEADICVLASPKISSPALIISKKPPLIGEKYYNIAAPMGVWSSQMIPLFEGYFLGTMRTPSRQRISYVFSIPTKGGSSGSPIINIYGEVVGAIHSAYRGFENLGLATTNTQIYLIYRQSIKKILKKYTKYKIILDLANI
jgi:S1-C subfamily serine protease